MNFLTVGPFVVTEPASTTATAAPTGPLAWVRTPASKSRKTPSTGAAVPAGADILLDSPMGNANSAPPATWKLNGPLFAEPRAEKRMATEDLEAENADPLLLDTELVWRR